MPTEVAKVLSSSRADACRNLLMRLDLRRDTYSGLSSIGLMKLSLALLISPQIPRLRVRPAVQEGMSRGEKRHLAVELVRRYLAIHS